MSAAPSEAAVLKHNARRTVTLEPAAVAGGAPRVVKRYHATGVLARWTDRVRARQEFALLAELARRGLSVPAPLELRERAGAWELVTEWIPNARTLAELLADPAQQGGVPARAARGLGRLLARMHALGLHHRDLHPGNLLLQPDGRAWLIDVRGARLGGGHADSMRAGDLIALAAAARERTSVVSRARVFLSYLRECAAAGLPELAPRDRRAAWIARIEGLARTHRREVVQRSSARWTRDSSVCEPFAGPACSGFVARGLTAPERAAVLAIAGAVASVEARAARPGRLRAIAREHTDTAGLVLAFGGGRPAVRQGWSVAARLHEHALGGARPLLLATGPWPFFLLSLPRGAELWHEAWQGADEPARTALAQALGALVGALADRKLDLGSADSDLYVAGGRLLVAGAARLDEASGRDRREFPTGEQRAAYERGWRSAQRYDPQSAWREFAGDRAAGRDDARGRARG